MANRTVDAAQATPGDGESGIANSLSGLVEVDDGLPEIFLGLNQTIMFGLFMVMIAGSIGSIDLSQEIFRALIFNDGGKGFVIGLCVAFIGLTTDRLLVEWAGRRKRMYGLVAQSKFGSAKSCEKSDHRI